LGKIAQKIFKRKFPRITSKRDSREREELLKKTWQGTFNYKKIVSKKCNFLTKKNLSFKKNCFLDKKLPKNRFFHYKNHPNTFMLQKSILVTTQGPKTHSDHRTRVHSANKSPYNMQLHWNCVITAKLFEKTYSHALCKKCTIFSLYFEIFAKQRSILLGWSVEFVSIVETNKRFGSTENCVGQNLFGFVSFFEQIFLNF
jgi:hypothetical protein